MEQALFIFVVLVGCVGLSFVAGFICPPETSMVWYIALCALFGGMWGFYMASAYIDFIE